MFANWDGERKLPLNVDGESWMALTMKGFLANLTVVLALTIPGLANGLANLPSFLLLKIGFGCQSSASGRSTIEPCLPMARVLLT